MTKPPTKPITTREKLLYHARRLLWAQGYSNVSVRQIAGAAEVDVALISRYFGGKLGLFEATLEGAFDTPASAAQTLEEMQEALVQMFASAPRGGEMPSSLRMILTNAHDETVGEMVRGLSHRCIYEPLRMLGCGPQRAALIVSVLMGSAVAEKTLRLPDYPAHDSPDYEAMLRHLLQAAINYKESQT